VYILIFVFFLDSKLEGKNILHRAVTSFEPNLVCSMNVTHQLRHFQYNNILL